jgi:hypothetical protein
VFWKKNENIFQILIYLSRFGRNRVPALRAGTHFSTLGVVLFHPWGGLPNLHEPAIGPVSELVRVPTAGKI